MAEERTVEDIWKGIHISGRLIEALEETFRVPASSQPVSDLNTVNYRLGQNSIAAFLRGKKLQAERREIETDNADDAE